MDGSRSSSAGRQLGLFWGGIAVALIALSPLAPFLETAAPACPFKTWTGIPCPGCGTTRAALMLADLDLLSALIRYPLSTLAWVGFLAGGLVAGGLALARRDLPGLPRRIPVPARIAAVLAVLANWAYSIATGV